MKKTSLAIIVVVFQFIQFSTAQTNQDCIVAFSVCEKANFHFNDMAGVGEIKEAMDDLTCFKSAFYETNSKWLTFMIAETGTLTFVIDPKNDDDDFDFILMKSEDGSCGHLTEVRCMASGANTHAIQSRNQNCFGITGLDIRSEDEFEKQGCKFSDDNFLKFLYAEKGEKYYLNINNYESSDGFSISFEGSALLKRFENCNFSEDDSPFVISGLFPNPAVDMINVSLSSLNIQKVNLEILNIDGKKIRSTTSVLDVGRNVEQLSLDKLASGTYLMRVSSDTYSTLKKFIKK